MTNILLIDESVLDSKIFIDSCNENTVPFVYSQNTTRENLLEFLQQNVQNSQIKRLGVVFEINPYYTFLNSEPIFENGIISTNTQFLINIIQQYKIENIDFLACETLLHAEWDDFYKLLMENTQVIVGASNNKTGNLLFGGDWIMESTNTDIELIYFSKSIEYYKYLLGISLHTVFVRNGNVYGCGDNVYGQLGDGTTSNRSSLVQMIIPDGRTPESVSSGRFYTIVKMTDGTIWGCGQNWYGQLGDGTTSSTSSLVQMIIPDGRTPESATCGTTHTIVKMTDGTIWGCGFNSGGQLGDGTTSNRSSLVQMNFSGNVSGKTPESVSCGDRYTIVKMTDGTIWGCGFNHRGQLGAGNNNVYSLYFIQMIIPDGRTPESVSCGTSHTIVKMTDGTIWGCGFNGGGQLGDGTTSNRSSLVQMIIPDGRTPESATCGTTHTIVKMTDGTIWGCGQNLLGQLGDGTTSNTASLVQMNFSGDVSGKTPESVSCGELNTIVNMTDGTIWGCGINSSGQLGNGTYTYNYITLVQMNLSLIPIPDYSNPDYSNPDYSNPDYSKPVIINNSSEVLNFMQSDYLYGVIANNTIIDYKLNNLSSTQKRIMTSHQNINLIISGDNLN